MFLRRPGRLDNVSYVGFRSYFLTICTAHRRSWFTDAGIAREVETQFLQTSRDYHFAVVAYCVMPDHLHAIMESLSVDADLRKCVAMFKQRSGFAHRLARRAPLWQSGYYDHVLRSDASVLSIAAYIVANPVRARLCRMIDEYAYVGSDRYSLTDLSDAIQMNPRHSQP